MFHVETLLNGLVRVFDRRCGWAALYRQDGTYAHGAIDRPDYREAALAHINRR